MCWNNADTQAAMNVCAFEEVAHANAELRAVYSKLLALSATEPEAISQIKAAETAWGAYRDAYIDATYPAKDKRVAYGSRYPMDEALLLADLTNKHVTDVKDLLKHFIERFH